MTLPWVRLDSNIGTHDKVLDLLGRPSGHKAFVLYICALGWSGAHGTDGIVRATALPMCHGNRRLADLLVDVGMFLHREGGDYEIRNFNMRQETGIVREMKAIGRQLSSRKANCKRWHGPDCECWREGEVAS